MNSGISEIWFTFCPVICVSHIAQARGLLKEEFSKDGIKISHISDLPPKDWQIHFSHSHPRLFRDGGNIPPIWARSEGANTKVIGMLFPPERQAILGREDSSIRSVKDLKGKRIALPVRRSNLVDFRKAMAKRGVIMSLKAHGLKETDVEWVTIPIDTPDIAKEIDTARMKDVSGWKIAPATGWRTPQQLEIETLQRGEVDAIYSSSGIEFVLEKSGMARVIYRLEDQLDWEYHVNIHYPYICTVSNDLACERPDIVTRWMKVLIRAGLWAKENCDEVSKIFSNAMEAGLSWEEIEKYYPDSLHLNLVPEITQRGVEALKIEKDFLREHGFISRDFDVESWIDRKFLDNAWEELT